MRRNGCYGSKDFFEKSRKVIKYELIVCLRKKNGYPKVNQDSVCLLSNRGPQSKPRFYLFAMGESGGTSCFNDDRVIGLRNLVTERASRAISVNATLLPNATPITYAQRKERHIME